jgi:hypothetical protein
VRVDETVGWALTARANPRFVVVAQEPREGARPAPRVLAHGHRRETNGWNAVLLETEVDGIHAFRLCSPDAGLAAVARWLIAARATEGDHPVGRTVEVLVPGDGGPHSSRAVVLAAHGGAALALVGADGAGEPRPIDAGLLMAWLRDATG